MRSGSWRLGAWLGSLIALIVASVMTFVDWQINPSGLFHDGQSTNWQIVLETAFSWFWPIALLSIAMVAVIHALILRWRSQ